MTSTDTDVRSHHPSRLRRLIDAIDERLGISALEYQVPEHANLAWSLGGVTAASFVVLLGTGVLSPSSTPPFLSPPTDRSET